MFPEGRWLEFLILGVITLVVVKPADLPILMRRVGQFVAKMRGMAAEFRASFDELARQSELDELRKEVEALRSAQPLKEATGYSDVASTFDDINASLAMGQMSFNPASAQAGLEAAEAAAHAEAPADVAATPPEASPEPPPSPPKPRAPRKPRKNPEIVQ